MHSFELLESIPGSLGPFDHEPPMILPADVRPYIVAILLHRGSISVRDAIASISPHCGIEDLKVGAWDPLSQDHCEGTRLEKIVESILQEFVEIKIVKYVEETDAWVLTADRITTIVSWVTTLNASFPNQFANLFMEKFTDGH